MMPADQFQPLQLKGEIMDLEFTVDTDHRKRRRNRTTQSCLNCHTSKRKCDRKRPCQRCIQLGLTGLCVYEIDDPALRDDPTLDETTRLRNRIAELESLVRELRGKPHPRWAESTFRDGDPNEKWHSRASKCIPLSKRRPSPPSPELVQDLPTRPSLLTPIKTETTSDPASHLYRFSPSPAPSMRYHTNTNTFQEVQVRGSPGGSSTSAPYNGQGAGSYHAASSTATSGAYNTTTNGHGGSSSYSDGGSNYALSGSDDGRPFTATSTNDHQSHYSPPNTAASLVFCSCRANPVYVPLAQQLQSTLNAVRYNHSPSNNSCVLLRRMNELNGLLQNQPTDPGADRAHYDNTGSSTTPTESEILTPLSAHSHSSFHSGGSVSPGAHDWNPITGPPSYNPYFSGSSTEHAGMYGHVMS